VANSDSGGFWRRITMTLRQRFIYRLASGTTDCVVKMLTPTKNMKYIRFPVYERCQFLRGPPYI